MCNLIPAAIRRLLREAGIDNKSLDSLKKKHNITMKALEKICTIVVCIPKDVVEFV